MDKRHVLKSFTLIELVVVVIIVAILVGLMLPNFFKAREQAYTKEALANLKLIAAAEKIYHVEYDTFINTAGLANINSNLKLMIPASAGRFDYKVDGANVDAFVAKAQRSGVGTTWCMNASTVDEPYNATVDPACSW